MEHLYAYFRKNGGDEKIAALDSVKWDVSVDCKPHSISWVTMKL